MRSSVCLLQSMYHYLNRSLAGMLVIEKNQCWRQSPSWIRFLEATVLDIRQIGNFIIRSILPSWGESYFRTPYLVNSNIFLQSSFPNRVILRHFDTPFFRHRPHFLFIPNQTRPNILRMNYPTISLLAVISLCLSSPWLLIGLIFFLFIRAFNSVIHKFSHLNLRFLSC